MPNPTPEEEPTASEATEALRRRLYQPGTTSADVRRYEEVRPAGAVPADVPARSARVRRAAARWTVGLVATTALLVAAIIGVARAAAPPPRPVPTPAVDRMSGIVLPAAVPVDGSTGMRALAVLAAARTGAPTKARADRIHDILRAAAVSADPPGGMVISIGGGGIGRMLVDLGAIGANASGHTVRVVVITTAGDHGWTLRGATAAGDPVVATTTSGIAAPTATTFGLPASVHASTIDFRLPAGTPFAYYIDVTG